MNKIDKDGLILCKLQGDIFSSSIEFTKCSSEIFMRRFMTSNLVKEFDLKAVLNDSLTVAEAFLKIEEEFGITSYGKIKYNKEVLFWIGYLYRYMAYIYNLSSKYIYKIIKPKELCELYYVYHTFDPYQAIERILEIKNISFDLDKQNERLLKIMRKNKYEREIDVVPLSSFNNSFFDKKSVFKENVVLYNKSKILLEIVYHDEVIGYISFDEIKLDTYELEIRLINEKYENKGIGTIALKKSLIYLSNELKAKAIVVKIIKSDEKCIHIFKKLGFFYQAEDDDFASYKKLL